ncbi:MAG TPA: isoamylase early set domain-containing protein [Halothiobacillus sp.]|nr:MAG: glycoside hydrolase [Halothiobacillus sp. 20-54-6]HQT44101.1 isoamylase early set domain-containing protein [Halothiobacillus sp.]
MSLIKKPLKTRPVCKVTFTLPSAVSTDAKTVTLVGDFNEWSETSHPLKYKADGLFSVTLDLPTDHRYQFRYLVDGTSWHNDDAADEYVPTPFGNDTNSIVRT